MDVYVYAIVSSLIGMICTAWIVAKAVNAKHEREQNLVEVHRRIDEVHQRINEAERVLEEKDALLERNLTEVISNVQQELIRENASILNRVNART